MKDSNNTPNNELENTNNIVSEIADNEVAKNIYLQLKEQNEALDRREKCLDEREERLDKREDEFNNKELSLKQAVSRLNEKELHYLSFTMADIVKYLTDNEALYDDQGGQNAMHGALNIEDMAKQELILRRENQFTEARMKIEEIKDDHPGMYKHLTERLEASIAELS